MTEPEEEPGGEGRSPSVTPRCCGGAMRAGRCGTRRLRAQGAGRTAPPCLASQRLADRQHFGGRLRHRRAPPPGQSQRCEAEVTSYPPPNEAEVMPHRPGGGKTPLSPHRGRLRGEHGLGLAGVLSQLSSRPSSGCFPAEKGPSSAGACAGAPLFLYDSLRWCIVKEQSRLCSPSGLTLRRQNLVHRSTPFFA